MRYYEVFYMCYDFDFSTIQKCETVLSLWAIKKKEVQTLIH